MKDLDELHKFDGVRRVASALETDFDAGICGSDQDIARRREAFGSNTYKKPPSKSLFYFVVDALKDLTILILLGCAVLSLAFGIKEHGLKEGWYDGGSILVLFGHCHFSWKQLYTDSTIGDQVPADGLFLDGHSLQVDESSMTGESDHLEVNSSQNPFLFSGTKVADGYARMLATSVGMNTTWGQRMSQISRDNSEQTPLQARLNELTSSTGKIGLAVAFLALVVLLLRYFTGNTTDENGNQEYNGSKTKVDDIVNAVVGIVAATVTIIEVAIPEGLPLAVTLTLAYSMKRMMADQVMVRKLSACETMGSATTIGTDKTGTLTENRMKVTKFWLGKELVKEADASSVSPNIIKLIQEGVALNTTGSVYRETSVSDVEFSGSPTEKAILSWAVLEMNMDMEEIAVLLTLQFIGESIFGVNEKVKDTLIFNTFVLCHVFNEFNARKLEKKNVFEGIHKNRLFLGIIGTTIVFQVVMVEFLKKFADTERLSWGQ
ncbi:putative calcium-transporting ATPase 13 plasma membrane-type [Citrus sinensis]|uniref:Calcium-transporting ATPase 13 plasma membrane-type n=1 Tax=Citrus sinensis TaxID=2711 RepID=A0ACB8I5Y1_CITSI|nr:putative calcium-transporting ATPase 13 plasma membrane-type [Citrus sinensis]